MEINTQYLKSRIICDESPEFRMTVYSTPRGSTRLWPTAVILIPFKGSDCMSQEATLAIESEEGKKIHIREKLVQTAELPADGLGWVVGIEYNVFGGARISAKSENSGFVGVGSNSSIVPVSSKNTLEQQVRGFLSLRRLTKRRRPAGVPFTIAVAESEYEVPLDLMIEAASDTYQTHFLQETGEKNIESWMNAILEAARAIYEKRAAARAEVGVSGGFTTSIYGRLHQRQSLKPLEMMVAVRHPNSERGIENIKFPGNK